MVAVVNIVVPVVTAVGVGVCLLLPSRGVREVFPHQHYSDCR